MEETNIGYIIRNEQVVKGNNYKNGMEQIKNEGEKTSKGDSIYRYYSQNEEQLKKEISKLDGEIQEALKGQKDIFSPTLEKQLDEKIELLSKTTDISKMIEYNKQISDIITKKAKISGESSAAGTHLKELYNKRTTYEEQLNSGAEYITAPNSGIVSYKVDGLEEVLTPNNFSSLSKEFLESLKLKTGQLIATNEECGKIIDSSSCYIVTISSSEKSKSAKLDDKVKIRLEIDREINELTNYRKISFDLIWWTSTGLKVPNQAIVEENGLKYVVRSRAGYLSKILVKVNKENEKYSIVSNYNTEELNELGFKNYSRRISIYDELILNPDLSKVE